MPSLRIERAGPGATVQALSRSGFMHHGVPPGGPLVPELCAASNASLGNGPDDAVIEAPLSTIVVRAQEACTISINGHPIVLAAGESITAGSPIEAVTYVAVPGGFDVPVALGSRGTLQAARLGGHEGRGLRNGDLLRARLAEPPAAPRVVDPGAPDPHEAIRVVLGPDHFPQELVEALLTSTFRLSPMMDRVGQRLDGARLSATLRDRPGSMPMVRGAIQVTLDGTPIILGPDHPTTGGYPVIAVVVTADLGKLARRRPGAEVRFSAVQAPHPGKREQAEQQHS